MKSIVQKSWAILIAMVACPLLMNAQIVLNLGTSDVQDFNSLSNSGQSTALPAGWHLHEDGSFGNNLYEVSDGSISKANTYSWGTTSSTDRAFGMKYGVNVQPIIGARLKNESGHSLYEINIALTVEQWFLGLGGNGFDKNDFQYSTDATSLTTGTWTDLDALDMNSLQDGLISGPLDGNDAANRSSAAAILSGLNVADGAIFWIRWVDTNAPGKDDGLGIDDVTIDAPSTVFYADADGDSYGDAATSLAAFSAPAGYVANNSDCNDADASINPSATEVCDGIDNNCEGNIDEGVQLTFYADTDGDGYGDANNTTLACTVPSGYVENSDDCDDTDASINPDGTEICDGLDNNCDGNIDEGVLITFYADTDGDSYGDAGNTTLACSAPAGYVSDNTDCDDTNSAINPGATEVCDGVDNNCDGDLDPCEIPTNITISDITSSTALVTWDGDDCGVSYRIRNRIVGTTEWTYASETEPSRKLVNKLPNTEYEVQVQKYCNIDQTDSSDYSASVTFTTAPDCVAPTNLLVVADNSSATFNWDAPATGTSYTIRYRTVGSSTWTIVKGIDFSNTSYVAGGLTSGTEYEWQMKTKCNSGADNSNWAVGSNFFTTVKIGQFVQQQAFELYPNPSNGIFHLNYAAAQAGQAIVSVSDLLGKVMHAELVELNEGNNHTSLNLNLANGIYFVTIKTESKMATQRIEIIR